VAQHYRTASSYVSLARLTLQDEIIPYRYPDQTLVDGLNLALDELTRIRPDMYLDLKYQHPLVKGDIDDGEPGYYALSDIVANGDGTYGPGGTLVPVPSKYTQAIDWFIAGWVQFLDVTDTQDQRAQGFLQKFQTHLTTLTAG
jgi:hypothetical protein